MQKEYALGGQGIGAMSEGRIAIARVVGYGPDARSAQLALLELGTDVCLPLRPKCGQCPLRSWCRSADDFS